MTKRFPRLLAFGVAAVVILLGASACSLIGNDDKGDDNGNGNSGDASGVTAPQLVLTTDLGQLPARAIVPQEAREIDAVVNLAGIEVGDTVTARWYQLGVADVPPEGLEVSTKDLVLEADQVTPEGTTFATFRLTSNGFPEDSWLLRVYVNGSLVRTYGFVVTAAANGATPQQVQPTPTAEQAAPEPTETPVP